jgi:DNA-binding response OmpR family regulator
MPKTIVVADDEADALNAIKVFLEMENYTVHTAPDGKSAIETVLKVKPDLLVVDDSMPELKGRDVCRQLREHQELQSMKILLMSAAGFDLKAAQATGADSFIGKPFEIDALLAEVQKLLG